MFINKISKLNNLIKMETKDKIIEFPIYPNENLQDLLLELNEHFTFNNVDFIKFCLNIFLKPKTRILSILNVNNT